MTINREAAEQMAARLTSTISSAVDAAETFNEALRLATVALQETREVPEVEPGTVGTATVRGVEGVRVVRTDRSPESDLTGVWFTPVEEQIGGWWHPESEVTSFVPDSDTAALRAEVERLTRLEAAYRGQARGYARQRNEARDDAAREHTRAEAAEARLARLTPEAATEAILAFVKRAGVPSWVTEAGAHRLAGAVLALAAADEQAAEGEAMCTCKVVNGGGCLGGCTDQRVIDPTCPAHHDPIACGDPSCDC